MVGKGVGVRMTELKTLIDIQRCGVCDTDFKLRQEAIKWIKKIEGKYLSVQTLEDKELLLKAISIDLNDWYKEYDVPSIIWFIKHFFNIEEEDLK